MANPKTKPKAAKPGNSGGAPSPTDASSSSFPALPEGAHDLSSLQKALGKPDAAFRRVLFRHHGEARLYEWGVQAETGGILADIPRFVSSSLRILAALEPGRRETVMVPPQAFAVLVDEAVTLEGMSKGHEVVATSESHRKTDRELTLKRRMGEGVALRDRVLGGLRSAVGDPALVQVRGQAGDASSPDTLAKGLNAVAAFLDDTLKNGHDDDKAALAAFQLGPARSAELREKAAALLEAATVTAATEKRVSKRSLDLQDGRVLVLVDMIHRAFRLARRSDRSILLPELNRLAGLFSTTSGGSSAKDSPAPAGDTTTGDTSPA